jgi:hypothetical protein
MNAAYDHLVAIVLVGAIFVGTVVAMPAAMSFTTSQAVDQQQMRNTALNVFTAMLQGTGSPVNWGSIFPFSQSSVKTFGLAYSGTFSNYVLDANKVQRLDPRSPFYMNYSYARDLLNLKGYGFQFSLFRPFRVDWDIQWSNQTNYVWLGVNVTRTEDGAPIANAIVKANIIATATNQADKDSPGIQISEVAHETATNLLGRAEISENINITQGYTLDKAIAVMHIIVSGMDTMVIASRDTLAQECLKINTFGDTITLTFWDNEYYSGDVPNGARWVENIYGYDLQNLLTLYTGGKGDNNAKINNGAGLFDVWNMTFPGLSMINPSMLIFVLNVPLKTTGRTLIVIAGPFSFDASNKIFEFGPGKPTGAVLTTMRRFVIISGMTYVSELLLWKE